MESIKQFAGGSDLVSQLFLAILALFVVLSLIYSVESVVTMIAERAQRSAVLFKDTTTSQQLIAQDPDDDTLPYAYNSKNESHGLEFTYSMYLMINPETFDQTPQATPTLKHVFHKGFKNGFPVMAPGVFVQSDTNTLRIYMNSAKKWNTYVPVQNVPVGKWFHMVIMMKGQYMDVYINGNVTQRNQFADAPRINAGNIYVMWPMTFPVGSTASPDAQANLSDFKVNGAMSGMVSRLKYYAYALTYSDIDGLFREGPSSTIVNKSFTELPPYFHDDWWVTRY